MIKTASLENETEERPPLPGYRLSKLEVYNWGTFDGSVYSVCPRGQTTLLIGENGSGKSTLVDALLTLLVRPQTRNYNVAAGATKNERDERTYIRGAYDRTIGDAGRPQVQYLRSGSGHYTALLASFVNQATKSAFTIAQVLYLASDNSVEKVYLYSDGERGIVQDMSNLSSGSSIAKTLRDRGFQTTSSYKQYASWLQRKTNFRSKAMDIFNQTVAVKDVQRLDIFIRQHMLEAKPWKEKVDQLLTHFNELSEAHRTLVRVRQQDELLQPIAEAGKRFRERQTEIEQSKRTLSAVRLFFANDTVKLLEPLCETWSQQVEFSAAEIQRLEKLQSDLRTQIARLTIDIEQAGGDRLRQLPGMIEQAEQIAKVKQTARRRFESLLEGVGMRPKVTSPEQFHKTREQLAKTRDRLLGERLKLREQDNAVQRQIGALVAQLSEDQAELAALERRKNNLPETLIALRERMCRDLKISPSDLPYVAELIAVAPEQREWEASIEQVLHGFARSLLVANEYYARVAGYVDRTRLEDAHGKGQRLVYLKVSTREKHSDNSESSQQSMVSKLEYRLDHSLSAWVRAEIRQRYDYQACETIEEFQRAKGAAMTKNRHLKSGPLKHEKDDRSHSDERRHFVLGWDNREKRLALANAIQQTQGELQQLQDRSAGLSLSLDRTTAAMEAIDQALQINDFDTINHERHEFEASQLRLEKQRIEESDDKIRELKKRRSDYENEAAGYLADRDQLIAQRTTNETQLRQGHAILDKASRILANAAKDESLERAESEFEDLRSLTKQPLTLDNIGTLPQEVEQRLRQQFEKLQERLVPLERDMTSAMTRFLKRFPDEQADLDANVESLPCFESLHARIALDDLPKHEERFKQRLNEKVLHEIGLLHGSLENDRQEIRDKIEQLNVALRLLEWKPGTFMRLETTDVQDREIQDFRRELAGCLNGTLDGTPEANEATFIKIEKLVAKLRDDGNDRWRQKVIDVRNWFNFAASEFVAATKEARSYYDGGTGQSGGEKGKLAFLVLVAAIAYQYDIDPESQESNRFHFVMVDEMFSRSDDQHAEYALDLFDRFGLQLLIVAPLDAKARVTEPYVGTYLHVVKNKQTNRSELLAISAEQVRETVEGLR